MDEKMRMDILYSFDKINAAKKNKNRRMPKIVTTLCNNKNKLYM